jgi:hypothetical protein
MVPTMLDLFEELRGVIASLDEAGIPYALCGGLAMAVHGYPRATVDIDIVAPADAFAGIEAAVRPLGFTLPTLPMTFRDGAIEIRRVSKAHASGQVLSLDVLLVTPPLEEAWRSERRGRSNVIPPSTSHLPIVRDAGPDVRVGPSPSSDQQELSLPVSQDDQTGRPCRCCI